MIEFFVFTIILLLAFIPATIYLYNDIRKKEWMEKIKYIENYQIPKLVLSKWRKNNPTLSDLQFKLGQEALKQFFMIYATSIKDGKSAKFDMPSKIVDDLWHEFLVSSREYHQFCDNAFGKYFHHTPHKPVETTDLRGKNLSSGLLNTFRASASLKNTSWMIGAVPILFMMDELTNTPGGFQYEYGSIEEQVKNTKANEESSAGSNCGTYALFGGDSSSDGGDGGSSSCGGGCGGD